MVGLAIRVLNCRVNVLAFQERVVVENLFEGRTCGQQFQDIGHAHAEKWPGWDQTAGVQFLRTACNVRQIITDANVRFDELRSLLSGLGFAERIHGDHHIFSRVEVAEILNLQPRGALAKPYQVKQVRAIIVRYKLAEGTE